MLPSSLPSPAVDLPDCDASTRRIFSSTPGRSSHCISAMRKTGVLTSDCSDADDGLESLQALKTARAGESDEGAGIATPPAQHDAALRFVDVDPLAGDPDDYAPVLELPVRRITRRASPAPALPLVVSASRRELRFYHPVIGRPALVPQRGSEDTPGASAEPQNG